MTLVKKMIDLMYNRVLRWNNPYFDFGISTADYTRSEGRVKFHGLEVTTDVSTARPLIEGYPYALKIHDSGGRFSISGNDILLELSGLRFRINSAEELFIIFEIFLMRTYRFCSVMDSVFVDIGMNAGIATLFYANDPNVKCVYAYELFRPTYALGMHNIDLNPQLKSKIKSFSFGLSNRSFTTTLDYSLSRKGRMGLKGLPVDEKFNDVIQQSVEVKDISAEFREIVERSESMDLIVKIDCEGEEYNLIDRLVEEDLVRSISVLMIEWHYKSPDGIEQRLTDAGFNVFSNVFSDLISGMVYASRRALGPERQ